MSGSFGSQVINIIRGFKMQLEDLKKNLIWSPDRSKPSKVRVYTSFSWQEPECFHDGTLQEMGFIYMDGWGCKPYLMEWVNPQELALFSYCEGDLTLNICTSQEIFVDEVRKAVKRLSSQFMGEPEKEILEII
jgi:hypothetical protein